MMQLMRAADRALEKVGMHASLDELDAVVEKNMTTPAKPAKPGKRKPAKRSGTKGAKGGRKKPAGRSR